MTFLRRTVLVVSSTAFLAAIALGQSSESQNASWGQSLGDIARKLRKDTTNEVRMTDADAKKLFTAVDEIFAFAAKDTGMPKRGVVKRRMVGKEDVEKFAAGRLAREQYTQRFAAAELSMKKFGFLPREFNLKEFLVKSTGANIAGYYDEETKTISMLNWVPADKQEPILAHELTHALQDQNYDLTKWLKAAGDGNDDSATARKAVVEGQAMVVYVDYALAPFGRNLVDTPGLIYQMEEPAVQAAADSQMMHDAPMILREEGTFAYNAGLIFEGELLHKGGRQMAFAGVFARPPHSSHEVLQPETYISGEKLPSVHIPDVHELLNNDYAVYDSGGIGELDVRALLRQFSGRKNAEELASAWQGGTYVTYRHAKDGAGATSSPGTADLALLYVSRWKSAQAAEQFARFYAGAIAKRYRSATAQAQPACSGTDCPVSSGQFATEEGPVIVEQWADNTVVVSESFDADTAAKLGHAIRQTNAGVQADVMPDQTELGQRLFEIPAFRVFEAEVGRQMAAAMIASGQ